MQNLLQKMRSKILKVHQLTLCVPPLCDTLNMRVGKTLSCMHALFTHNTYLLSCLAFFLRGGGEYVDRPILFERYVFLCTIYTDSRDSSDEGEEEEEEGGEGGDTGRTQPKEEDEAMEVEAEKASEQQGIQ